MHFSLNILKIRHRERERERERERVSFKNKLKGVWSVDINNLLDTDGADRVAPRRVARNL